MSEAKFKQVLHAKMDLAKIKSMNRDRRVEIGEIPKGWEECVFSEAVNVNPKRELKKGSTAKFISMADLKEFNKKIQSFAIRQFSGGSKFVNGDTLMARITPCLENGKTAFVDILENGEVGCGSTEFMVLCGKDGKSINQFVYYLAVSPQIRQKAIKSMTGTSGRQRVESNVFDKLIICLPNIVEQRAIAKILSALDEKIELNHQMNKTLESIAQAIFKRWFVDFEFPGCEKTKFVKGIPENWRISRIGDELLTVLGGTPAREKSQYWDNGTIPWINSGKANEFRVVEPSELITKEGLDNSATKLMPVKTTIIAITGATLGQVSLLEISACANQSIVGVLPSDRMPAEFIYFWIKNNINKLISWQTGGAQQHINKNNVNDLELLCPSEQVMQGYIAISKPLFEKIRLNCFESRTLILIRDSLLPRLMSGKTRVSLMYG